GRAEPESSLTIARSSSRAMVRRCHPQLHDVPRARRPDRTIDARRIRARATIAAKTRLRSLRARTAAPAPRNPCVAIAPEVRRAVQAPTARGAAIESEVRRVGRGPIARDGAI